MKRDLAAPRRQFLAALGGLSLLPWREPPGSGARRQRLDTGIDAGWWRTRVPALAQEVAGRPLTYLDNAATTLRPRAVIDALVRFYEHDNANPSASLHTLARRAAAALDAARARVARFLHADPQEIIFTRGTTEGLNLVASAWGASHLRAGDGVAMSVAEHASNMFPWQRLAAANRATLQIAQIDDHGRLPVDALDAVLTGRTRLVALGHVSNVLGVVNPAADLCALARRRGAAVVLDAAQSAPHIPLDVRTLGCDFLAFSSHKMLGPMGVGVLWVRADRLREMAPYHVGSNMAHGVDLDSAAFEPGAFRFQAGTPNVSGPVALAAALDLLDEVGFDAIRAHDRALARHALVRLGSIPGLRILGRTDGDDRLPVVSFTIDGVAVPAIVSAADAAGIALRGGDLAALPLLRRFGVDAAVRASAYLYNSTDEIDRLADVLRKLASRAP